MLESDKLAGRDTSACTHDNTSSSDDNNGTDLLNKGANEDKEKTSVTQEITEKDSGWAWIIALGKLCTKLSLIFFKVNKTSIHIALQCTCTCIGK